MNFFICELCGNIACGNFEGKSLGDCRFAYTRFTDKAGIVFAAPAKYLNRAVNFVFSADYAVKLAVARSFGEICAVKGQEFSLFIVFLALFFLILAFFFFIVFGV